MQTRGISEGYMADMTDNSGYSAGNPSGAIAFAGAVVSLGLLVGMGVWGYKLVMRDVQGIPVVRAAEGPMREAPLNPGGDVALNTGLAVNEVAALGGASETGDRLELAPAAPGLTEEDLLVQPTAEAGEVQAGSAPLVTVTPGSEVVVTALGNSVTALTDETGPIGAPMTAEEIIALADGIAAETAPLSALGDLVSGATAELDAIVIDAEPAIQIISEDLPGVRTAFRPPMRPASFGATDATGTLVARANANSGTVSAIDAVVLESQDITAELVSSVPVAVGTTMVQLGAFDSAEVAQSKWVELNAQFTDFISSKDMVIQEATSGDQVFYRLRALGFTDVPDARGFCSVLTAQQAACLPVVVQ